MKNLILTAMVFLFAFIQPINASDIILSIRSVETPQQVLDQILCPSGSFKSDEARAALYQIKNDAKDLYGIDVDLNNVVNDALKTMHQTGNFSEIEIEIARSFYSELLAPKTLNFTALSIFGRGNQSQELVLPDKMAGGFMLIFGGSLLCVLPFGFTQGLGTAMIVAGTAVIIESSAAGDKPHYIDTTTGQITPIEHPNSGKTIGIGTQF